MQCKNLWFLSSVFEIWLFNKLNVPGAKLFFKFLVLSLKDYRDYTNLLRSHV